MAKFEFLDEGERFAVAIGVKELQKYDDSAYRRILHKFDDFDMAVDHNYAYVIHSELVGFFLGMGTALNSLGDSKGGDLMLDAYHALLWADEYIEG